MTTPVAWGEVHPDDVILGRDGQPWRVTEREASTDRWLSAGTAGRQDMFTLVNEAGGRTVKAARPLTEVVPLLTRADRSAEASARDALAAVGLESTLIREGAMSTASAVVNTCSHPAAERSVLKDGRHYCTVCFETTYTPDGSPPAVVETRGAEVAVTAPADRWGVDASGTTWEIPAHVPDAESCSFGVHPTAYVTPLPTGVLGCALCTFAGIPDPGAVPATIAGHEHDLIKIMDGSTWCRTCVTTVFESGGDVEPVLSDPAPTVATVTVTEPPPAPVVDAFADPAPSHIAGHYEPPRDQWGRYKLPHPVTGEVQGWTRATTLSRVLADEYNLERWRLRQTVRGLATAPDLIALAASADPDDKATLDKVVRSAQDRASIDAKANLGTAFHGFTHRLSRGETIESMRVPAELIPFLHEYADAMKRHSLTELPKFVERIVVNTHVGAAGTFDRIVAQPPGNAKAAPFSVLDLKTGNTGYSWLEFAVQLAIYAHADYMWNPDPRHPAGGTYTPMPTDGTLDKFRALVLSLPVSKRDENGQRLPAALYAVNIDEGWRYAQLAEQARQARNGSKGLGWLVEPDPLTLLLHRISIADQAELARLWEVHHPAGVWTDVVNAAALERMARLTAVSP